MATGRPGILYAQNLFWLDDSCLERGFMLITLTTDFGHRDPFVGIMKGVIAGINPKAQVIDLTHGIPPQDVMAAALALRHSDRVFSARLYSRRRGRPRRRWLAPPAPDRIGWKLFHRA